MNSVWERFKLAVAADMDHFTAKREAKNPLEALNRYLKQAEKQTETTGKWLERQVTLNRQLENELAQATELGNKRTAQLELAKASGEEDLIRFAQAEADTYAARAAELKEALAESLSELNALEQRYEEMKHRLADMKIRQLRLMGKENITRAHYEIDRVLDPKEAANAVGELDELTDYIKSLANQVEEAYEESALKRRLETLQKKDPMDKKIV